MLGTTIDQQYAEMKKEIKYILYLSINIFNFPCHFIKILIFIHTSFKIFANTI